jgi:hypothetical protein
MSQTINWEKALRMKLTFLHKGVTSLQDLWFLEVEELDTIAVNLNASLETKKASFLSPNTKDELNTFKLEIVLYIMGVKQAEETAKLTARAEEKAKRDQKNLLDALIAEDEMESVRKLSLEEKKKLRDALS